MCGIAGYIGPTEIDSTQLTQCLSRMGRRGPDHAAAARYTTPDGRHVVLLHSRLSIIDLDPRSNQPLSHHGRHLVFNGELYNYRELREGLAQAGEVFATRGDGEVLLRVLTERGESGLDACEGMWGFALFDERDGSCLLSRDRFGEKPLYIFSEADGGLFFASEVKFIAALRKRGLTPNRRHLARFLVNGYKALYKGEETFFSGVREVPPGTCLSLSPGRPPQQHRYWNVDADIDRDLSFEGAVTAVREDMCRSVELRLRADVPLAFCMSGGVDSVSLISIAKRVLGHEVHGFTVVSTDERYQEAEMVDLAVSELGIDHTNVAIPSVDFRQDIVELVRQHDAPVYTISYYLHWLLMREIADAGYRVSISGTGADELFTGYYDHHNLYLNEVRGTPRYAEALSGWRQYIEPVVRNPHLQNPELYANNEGFREHIYLRNEVYRSYLHEPFEEDFTETRYSTSLLRNRMLNELFHESVPVILHEDDLNAMYFSIENRSPFLDRALFETSLRIPSAHLVQRGVAKTILREAMRGITPDPILDETRKVGFNAPVLSFLRLEDPDTRQWLLSDSPVFDLVKRDVIEALTKRAELPNSDSKFLFNFVGAKIFLEELC